MDRKRKRENPNTQVDKQGMVKSEALNSEKDDLETRNQMEHVDETTRITAISLKDEFLSTGFISNPWKGVVHAESNLSESIEDDCELITVCSASPNSRYANEVSSQRNLTLTGIMEALADDNVIIIGVYGTDSDEKDKILEKVLRRANRKNLFDMIVMASATKKPDLKRIQGQIADALDLTMEEMNIEERAGRLRDRIKIEQKILIILQDLCKGLDLEKLGIPFGANHTGCKILLTSTSEEILFNQMHAQKVFMCPGCAKKNKKLCWLTRLCFRPCANNTS